ncbi:MAG: hypothetical protein OEV81_00315 [Betaproteobacteria bacterium]|nr:hypothetical protein [Betaproteobacteria bacterium]MDH5220742.1 hypothetical protein [Betaproteobacteria bacterium]MDH5350514.1 hypothetical protein [Betaproteobacteria bacterium]
MSLIQEMLDRLSGVSVLRDRMNDLHATLRDHQQFILDHERRLARLEAGPDRTPTRPKLRLSK